MVFKRDLDLSIVVGHKARGAIAGVLMLGLGLLIAWVDTRPTWDDTGVTATAVAAAAFVGALGGVPLWVATVLVTAPVVLAELSGSRGVLLAIPFALAGAAGGALARRRLVSR